MRNDRLDNNDSENIRVNPGRAQPLMTRENLCFAIQGPLHVLLSKGIAFIAYFN